MNRDPLPPCAPSGNSPHAPIRTLLVDDIDTVRNLIETFLLRTGRIGIVGHASNGVEAVELTAQFHPDLVIMDVNMPVMDGVEATLQIKELPNPPRIIIVSMSDSWTEHLVMNAGADAFCDKRDALDTLLGHIEGLFPAPA